VEIVRACGVRVEVLTSTSSAFRPPKRGGATLSGYVVVDVPCVVAVDDARVTVTVRVA
jgi:hypothetical protein